MQLLSTCPVSYAVLLLPTYHKACHTHSPHTHILALYVLGLHVMALCYTLLHCAQLLQHTARRVHRQTIRLRTVGKMYLEVALHQLPRHCLASFSATAGHDDPSSCCCKNSNCLHANTCSNSRDMCVQLRYTASCIAKLDTADTNAVIFVFKCLQ